MKKLLSLAAIALVAGAASAVTMQWSTASAVQFGGSNLKSNNNVTGYLIALSAFEDSYTLDDTFDFSDVGTKVDDKVGTSAMSKVNKTWTIDTDQYGNGDTFALLLKYVKDGDTYWNLSSNFATISGMTVDPPVNAANTTNAFSYGTGTEGILTAGGGWSKVKPVPEPATGALALAGIALLFRRRKA